MNAKNDNATAGFELVACCRKRVSYFNTPNTMVNFEQCQSKTPGSI